MRKPMIRLLAFLFLPSSAFAQAASVDPVAAATAGSPYASFVPLLFIFLIFYVLLIRPQQKRMREHQALLAQIAKGDEVVTAGGILGKVTKVDTTDSLVIEIAKGVEVKVVKSTISSVVGKELPVTEKKKSGTTKNDNAVVSPEKVANDN